MTMTAPAHVSRSRRSALDRATALRLATTEYGRYLNQLRSLAGDDWLRPTDCPAWDVRAMAAHNLGMAEMAASLPEMISQFTAASRRSEVGIDALTAHQVEQRAELSPAQIVDRYAAAAPRAVRGRRRRSALIGRLRMPEVQRINGADEWWTFGFLFETILTRDCWMHRIDTARATGRELEVSADHDGTLVADVVAEWASRHHGAFQLTLTGPAGGSWSVGTNGERHELDAIEFCRVVSGRAPGTGLLSTEVPF